MKKSDKVLLVFLGLIVVVLFFGGQWWKDRSEFTTEKWVNYEGNSRQAILQNFLDRTVTDGMTEAQMTEYLGEPDFKDETTATYYLGAPDSLFGGGDGQEEYLVFTIVDGVVTEADKTTSPQAE